VLGIHGSLAKGKAFIVAFQLDGGEELRREAEDYRVVLNEQALDDQVSVFNVCYHLLLEAVLTCLNLFHSAEGIPDLTRRAKTLLAEYRIPSRLFGIRTPLTLVTLWLFQLFIALPLLSQRG